MLKKYWQHLLILNGVGLLVLFLNLGAPPLWDRDEPRNAACAREMMERNDWIVPTFNGELRVLKPAMKYWFMIMAYKMFGVNEFAARFWSAVFALATAWLTYLIGKRLFNLRTAFLSALVLLTNLLFVFSGHLAKIDAGLTFFSTLALWVYVRYAFTAPEDTPAGTDTSNLQTPIPQSWFVWAMIYGAIGLAVLAKGLPGAMPAAVLGMFLLIVRLPNTTTNGPMTWWQRFLACLKPFAPGHFLRIFWAMRPVTALIVVLAVAGPWYVLVGMHTDGEFLRGFFLDHHLGRAMQPLENHGGPFLVYYLVTVSVGLFPWSVFMPALFVWLFLRLRLDNAKWAACLLAACWAGVYIVLFSCARTKLPGYIAPCFPALALLVGALVDEVCTGALPALRFWVKLGLVNLGISGAVIVAGGLITARFYPVNPALALLGLVPLAGSMAALVLNQRGRVLQTMTVFGAMSVAFIALLFGFGLTSVGGLQQQHTLCDQLKRDNARFGSFGILEPSWVFYAGHPITPVATPITMPATVGAWKVQPVAVDHFLKQGEHQFIITTDAEWEALRRSVPEDVQVIAETPRFFRQGRWLIVGR